MIDNMNTVVFDFKTGKSVVQNVSGSPEIQLEDLRTLMLSQVDEIYKTTITSGFTSSATGSPLLYGYQPQDQLNYSKWANVLALDSTRTSVTIGTVNSGVVELTREQFLTFVQDATNFEMELYQKKIDLKNSVISATSFDKLNAIDIKF